MMSQSDTPNPGVEQELSPEEQFFALLSLGRILIELGITPYPDFGLIEYDACALLNAHSARRLKLEPVILSAVIRISRGEGYRPNRTVRRNIERLAQELYSRSKAVLEAISQPLRSAGATIDEVELKFPDES